MCHISLVFATSILLIRFPIKSTSNCVHIYEQYSPKHTIKSNSKAQLVYRNQSVHNTYLRREFSHLIKRKRRKY
ncbi:unnamed protein product [Callosobruchus maculatus]|uniref:Secreted protein n=1 Tax=Callosobruchus maculatus TaxID=64391 RepID=A0A653CX98_CALMS|nr:unnamed protein product [Callosobruchus maculatus]